MLTNPDTMASLVDAAIIIIEAFAEGWINSMPVVLEHAPVIIENIVTAITENLPKILDCAGEVIDELVQGFLVNLPSILEAGGQIFDELGTGITSSIMSLIDAWNRVDETLDNVFKEMWESAFASGKDLIDGFIKGIKEKWENLKETAIGAAQLIKDYLGFSEPKYGPLSNFHTYAPDMMDLFSEGIKENTSKVTDHLSDSLSSVSNEFDGIGTTDGAFSGTSNYYITITSGTISSDYDARRAAQQMSEELGNIKKFGNMAVGG